MSAIVEDQASRLRRLVASMDDVAPLVSDQRSNPSREDRKTVRPRRIAHSIAIASGKGGVGKTSIAVNLAIRLSQIGYRVVLVDADLGTANADVMMNIQARFDLSHVLHGTCTCREAAVRVNERLRLIVGASGLPAIADADSLDCQLLIDELSRLEQECDVMILDCGAGVSENVLAFARSADELLVVTTPEPTAWTDAYAFVKVLSQKPYSPSIGLVINQVRSAEEGRRIAQRISHVAKRFLRVPIRLAGHILFDPHVTLAVRKRVPLVLRYPRCPASTCLSTLARRLKDTSEMGKSCPGFFRRVIGFFD